MNRRKILTRGGPLVFVLAVLLGATACENNTDAVANCDLARMMMEDDGRLPTKIGGNGTWGVWDATFRYLNESVVQYECRLITLQDSPGGGWGFATFIIQEDPSNGTDNDWWMSIRTFDGHLRWQLPGHNIMCEGRRLPSPASSCP